MKKPRAFTMSFASVYPLYIEKAEKKGRTKDEVDNIIFWLTGYNEDYLKKQIDDKVDMETFYNEAPQINPNASLMYVCGNSTKVPKEEGRCTGHRIEAEKLMSLISETLKKISAFAKEDETAFAEKVNAALSTMQTDKIKEQKKRLAKLKKRTAELDTLFKKIYEDNTLGKLPDNRFSVLLSAYEKEQETIEKEIPALQSAIDNFKNGNEKAKQFTELVKRYRNFDEVTVSMLNEFVEKIIVHERDRKGKIDSTQKVEIHLNFIGEFAISQTESEPLTPEQEEEKRKLLERRERLHQNYLKRKASGKQKEWEEKYEPKRKARMAANKAALLEKGVPYIIQSTAQ